MAALFDSDSEEEEFIGFTIESGFERNYPESESDISVSSVDTEDLSDLDLSNQESGEEDEQEWNDDPGPVVVNPFVANTGLVRDVRGYSTINFFNLMFKDSNFDKLQRKRIVMRGKQWKQNRTLLGVKPTPKKLRHSSH